MKTSKLTMVLIAILALTMTVGCDGFFSIQPEPVKGAAGEYEPIAFPAEAQMKVVLADQTGNPIPPPEFPIGVKYTVPDQSRGRVADTQFAGEDQTAPLFNIGDIVRWVSGGGWVYQGEVIAFRFEPNTLRWVYDIKHQTQQGVWYGLEEVRMGLVVEGLTRPYQPRVEGLLVKWLNHDATLGQGIVRNSIQDPKTKFWMYDVELEDGRIFRTDPTTRIILIDTLMPHNPEPPCICPEPTPEPTKPPPGEEPEPTPTPTLRPPRPHIDIRIDFIHFKGKKTNESDEYVQLENHGDDVNLKGWKLRDIADGRPTFVFPSYLFRAGDIVRVYTDETHPSTGRFSFGESQEVWDNFEPDVAALYDPKGRERDTATYEPLEEPPTPTEEPPADEPPTAIGVDTSVDVGGEVLIDLQATDAETCELEFTYSEPTNGSVATLTNHDCQAGTPNSDTATVQYTHDGGNSETDSFTYEVCDEAGQCATGTINLTMNVEEPPDAEESPTAQDVSVTIDAGSEASITLEGSDVETCELTFTPNEPTNGTLSSITDQSCQSGSPNSDTATLTYTHDGGESTTDSFTYEVCDEVGECAIGTVSITILPTEEPPTEEPPTEEPPTEEPPTGGVTGSSSVE